MEHCFFHATAAVVMTAAAVSAIEEGAQVASPALPYPALNLPLVVDDDEVKRRVEAGVIDLLLGWEEHAQLQFAHAIEQGSATGNTCLMAYCGMMLASDSAGEKDANRMLLQENIDKVFATPVELFYLNNFLKLMEGDMSGAASDFEKRAEQYRADLFSALWACMLYHCSEVGYDMLGRPNPKQQKALDSAQSLYEKYPENPLVCYVRAYIEEGAPQVSTVALEAAAKAVEGMPGHPMPALLYGHLLYRSERADEAVEQFKKAAELSENDEIPAHKARLNTIAKLYQSTALWSARKTDEALKMRRAMNGVPLNRETLEEPATVLQRWETNTLPLRVLILRKTPPTVGEIRAAANAATPKPALPDDDPVLLVRDCLRAALYARARIHQNDKKSAIKSLELARESLAAFEKTQDAVFKKGNHYVTPWYRALEACNVAVLAAGAEVTPDSETSWRTIADCVRQPINMLMPPPVPEQFGPEPHMPKAQDAPQKMNPYGKRNNR